MLQSQAWNSHWISSPRSTFIVHVRKTIFLLPEAKPQSSQLLIHLHIRNTPASVLLEKQFWIQLNSPYSLLATAPCLSQVGCIARAMSVLIFTVKCSTYGWSAFPSDIFANKLSCNILFIHITVILVSLLHLPGWTHRSNCIATGFCVRSQISTRNGNQYGTICPKPARTVGP